MPLVNLKIDTWASYKGHSIPKSAAGNHQVDTERKALSVWVCISSSGNKRALMLPSVLYGLQQAPQITTSFPLHFHLALCFKVCHGATGKYKQRNKEIRL